MRKSILNFLNIRIIYFTFILIFFIYYLILYIYYYKAIIGYSDTAFQFFYILQYKKFALFHLRYIAIFPQLFAYITSHLSLDINFVMKAHVVNIVLLYVFYYIILAFVLKKKYVALLILMLPSFMQHFSFYYPIHELMYGFGFFILPITYIYFNIENLSIKTSFVLAFVSFVFFIFIHPLYNIIGVILFSVFILIKNKYYKNWLIFVLIGLFLFFIKIKLLSGYEKNHLNNFSLESLNWQSIEKSYLTYFLKDTLNQRWYILSYFLLIIVFFLTYRRQFLYIICFIGVFIAIFLLTYIYLPNGGSLAYMEAYLLPIFATVIFLFFLYLEENYKKNAILLSILIIPFCVFGLFRNKSEKLYINRAKFIENICNLNNGDCFLIASKKETDAIFLVGWAVPFESLLLSSANGKSKTIYLSSNIKELANSKDTTKMLGTSWFDIKFSELNPAYFYVQPQAYQLIDKKILH